MSLIRLENKVRDVCLHMCNGRSAEKTINDGRDTVNVKSFTRRGF